MEELPIKYEMPAKDPDGYRGPDGKYHLYPETQRRIDAMNAENAARARRLAEDPTSPARRGLLQTLAAPILLPAVIILAVVSLFHKSGSKDTRNPVTTP